MSLLLAHKLYRARRSEVGLMLTLISLSVAFWLLMESLSFYTTNQTIVVFYQKLKYIAIVPITPLLTITIFGMIWKYSRRNIMLLLILFILPTLTVISLITNVFPFAFISNASSHHNNGIPVFSYERELGFYIHIFYAYLLLITNNIILLFRAIKSPRIYRIQSMFLFVGSFVTTVINMLFVFQIFGHNLIDTTPISILITIAIYYWGVYILPKNLVIPQARNLIIENMTDMIITVDNNDKIIDVNSSAKEMIGKTSSLFTHTIKDIDYSGLSFNKLIDSLEFTTTERVNQYLSNTNYNTFNINIEDKTYYFDLSIEELIDTDHRKIGKLYILRDVSSIQRYLKNLLQLNEHLQVSDKVINEAQEGIVITDKDNKIVRVNNSIVRMSGYQYYELLGETPKLLASKRHDYNYYRDMWDSINERDFWEGEIWNKKKTGEIYPNWMTINVIKDDAGNITNYISISSDISKMKEAEKDLQQMAYFDTLTGLPNRALFNKRLAVALKRTMKYNDKLAIMYLDLDRFKVINDTYGHSSGDQLLIEVTKRLEAIVDKQVTISRLSGDDFIFIFEELDIHKKADQLATKIMKAFDTPFIIDQTKLNVNASMGIAFSPDDDSTAEGLMRKIDMAMYSAKEKGGNQYTYYSNALEVANKDIHYTEIRLTEAIKQNEFELYLQPQVALVNGKERVVGAEALIRWPQADGSMISPYKFIQIAERSGQILDIGLFVLEETFRLFHQLKASNIELALSFNASIKQFTTNDFYNRLCDLMKNNENKDIQLTMEVTESLLFEDVDKAIDLLNSIKSLGVNIALDDFGTGYSSMSYLNKLPLDYVKIDKSFIDEMDLNSNKNLAHMIISMAKTLDFKVVAEGVEEKVQADSLYHVNCDVIQGYYYSKPLPIDHFIKFVKTFNQ